MKHGFWERIKQRFQSVDRDDVVKWSCIVGGGLLALVGSVFDQRKKDRVYRQECRREIPKAVKAYMDDIMSKKNAA